MYSAAHTHRGPSPWRGPAPARGPHTDADRLVVVAWLQLAGVLLWSAWLAFWASLMFLPGTGALACLDGELSACGAAASSLDRLAVPAGLWSMVIVLGIAAVVAVHRHRRGAASLPAALVLLAAAPFAAMAAERIARVPLPFFF